MNDKEDLLPIIDIDEVVLYEAMNNTIASLLMIRNNDIVSVYAAKLIESLQGERINMTFTKEQIEKRRSGIGASEAASVLGLNPYRTPLEVWMQKKGLVENIETPAMRLGTRLEPVIAEMYQEVSGRELVLSPTLFYKNPVIFGTPDRIVKGMSKGVEIKTANTRMSDQWGEDGTDEVPQYYLIQCILCMAVTGFPEWDVAVLLGGQDFRIYSILRDIDLENSIIEKLLEWWETYIVGNREPDIDSSRSCADYLAIKYPKNFKPLKEADADTEKLIQRLAEVRYSLKSYEEQEEAIKNLLKNYIGDAEGVQGLSGKCTWKATKDTKQTDYQAIYAFLHSFPAFHEFLKKHEIDSKTVINDFTTIKPGVRRFLFSAK